MKQQMSLQTEIAAQEPVLRPLLQEYHKIPSSYIKEVADIKRVLERWVADPAFELDFNKSPKEAIASLGVAVTPEEIYPLINAEESIKLVNSMIAGDYTRFPLSTYRYKSFIAEKLEQRKRIRDESRCSNPEISTWRDRQIKRCVNELGLAKSDAIVHPPVAFELSKGCTVGCWFCGIDAAKFSSNWSYTPENALLWNEVLLVVKDFLGTSIKNGFLYWATDPLDNPEYEKFLIDFFAVTGRCAQTTTALSIKDVDRTRTLLNFNRSLDLHIDRFSVLSLNMLKTIHASFTPEELIKVECIPQNREAKGKQLKSNAGRARIYAAKKSDELTKGQQGDTIACVSGFLFNMPDKEVRLVTPCQANDQWPLGYWVLGKAKFNSAADLKQILHEMVNKHMKIYLRLEDRIQLRQDIKWYTRENEFILNSSQLSVTFANQKNPTALMRMLETGDYTVEEIALTREKYDAINMSVTLYLLDELFSGGFIREDPNFKTDRIALKEKISLQITL
jgi:radical SAM family RiPP maturation amino acid epimerase